MEDSDWLRDLLARYIKSQPDLEVCGSAGSAERSLAELPAGADVLVVDLALGDGMSGLELIRAARQRWPEIPCVVLSAYPGVERGASAQDAGAVAYVEKGDIPNLLSAIRSAPSSP